MIYILIVGSADLRTTPFMNSSPYVSISPKMEEDHVDH